MKLNVNVVLITNIPAPYRLPIYEIISSKSVINFKVIFCAKSEPNRKWVLDNFNFNYAILKKRKIFTRKDKFRNNYIHFNPDLISEIRCFRPDVIINTGYNPTNLLAWIYALIFRCKHIVMTDGTKLSESNLSIIHEIIRKVVFKTSSAFIGASNGSIDLFARYGVNLSKCVKSCLCVQNDRFKNHNGYDIRQYDLMFSGQFIDGKLPLFFIDVIIELYRIGRNVKVLIIGDGPLKEKMITKLDDQKIDYFYAGHIDQSDLPNYYSNSKLLLFPTLNDPWGIVANEALASGTPVLTTSDAGVSNDLVIDSKNGYILPIDISKWAVKITYLLENPKIWTEFSQSAFNDVADFNFDNAANGLIDAVNIAINNSSYNEEKQ